MLPIHLPRVHSYLGRILCCVVWGGVGACEGRGGVGGFTSVFEELFASINKIFILVFPTSLRPKSYVV